MKEERRPGLWCGSQPDTQLKEKDLGRSWGHLLLGKGPQWWEEGPGWSPASVVAAAENSQIQKTQGTRAQD